ncbi:MAG: polyphenol oxidase family protein [Solirubrobacterales bacterium]
MIRVSLDSAEVLFTTRRGGDSAGPYESLNLGVFTDDDPRDIAANLEAVRSIADLEHLHWPRQVHGGEINRVAGMPAQDVPVADGLQTSDRGVGLMTVGADCIPLAIAGPDSIAVLHCGWRPTAAGIVESAIARLGGDSLQAAIGPGISQANYEVGTDVVTAIGSDAEAHYVDGRLSLRGVLRTKLQRAGVAIKADLHRCTFAEPDQFFSHRRDGVTGRQAGIAWLR